MRRLASCLVLALATTGAAHGAGAPAPALAPPAATAQAAADTPRAALTPGEKVALTNAVAAGVILGWGLANWDYGQRGWHTMDEGWFTQNTAEGGADKMGHAWSTYVLGRGLTGLFRGYGHERPEAVGTLSSLGAMTLMELGDGFSPYGFSGEDQAMNLAGAGLSWLLATHPELDRRWAFRGEYHVNRHATDDVLTDYERWRYYAVLKLDGFDGMPAALRWVELHAGWHVRGYEDRNPANDTRTGFVGIGLSLTRLAREAGWQRSSTFLDYFQLPHTVARADETR